MSSRYSNTRQIGLLLLPSSFGFKLSQAFEQHGQLCVGIDPHESLFDSWGLDHNVQGLDYFANKVVELSAGLVGIIKPQVSFFERFGSEGFRVLEITNQRATDAGLVVISDAKRGDIGSTMVAYLDAWLGRGSSFASDALTVNPFLGLSTARDLMQPYLETERAYKLTLAAGTALILITCIIGIWFQLKSEQEKSYAEGIQNTFRLAVDGAQEELYMLSQFLNPTTGEVDFKIEDSSQTIPARSASMKASSRS
jgi:hypothetical protein